MDKQSVVVLEKDTTNVILDLEVHFAYIETITLYFISLRDFIAMDFPLKLTSR